MAQRWAERAAEEQTAVTRVGSVEGVPEDMREIVLELPGRRLDFVQAAPPTPRSGEALVRTILTGIDATDEEVLAGEHGRPPEAKTTLVPGHECLGEIVTAPGRSGVAPGDLVVPLVRHGCGMCRSCRYDASDMCPSRTFVEHGIQSLDGFMRDYWVEPVEGLVRVPHELGDLGILIEPLSIAVKALEEARWIQRRIPWFVDEGGFRGKRALVAGTGSIGSLAAFLLRNEGMHVWSMDRSPEDTHGSRLLRDIGAAHVNARETRIRDVAKEAGGFDLVIEATGAPEVVFDTVRTLDTNGVMCMLGVPPEKDPFDVQGDAIMREMVEGNKVLFGSVNSNRHHFEIAIQRLLEFKDRWPDPIERVITHVYAPEQYQEAFEADDANLVKKVIDWRRGQPSVQP